jgi:hypothetical protein
MEIMRSSSTLRFRERNEPERDLSRYGFTVIDVRDGPDRPGKEMVFLTQVRCQFRPRLLGWLLRRSPSVAEPWEESQTRVRRWLSGRG